MRRFFAELRDRWRRPRTLPIYDLEEVTALMDGWQTHVAKQRAIHEQSARLDQPLKQESDLINQLQATLRDIGASAPIPPRWIADRVDRMDVESRSSVFADRRNPPPRSVHAG